MLDDIIEEEHKHHSPNCPLVLGQAKENIPLENDPEVQNYAPTPLLTEPVKPVPTYSQAPTACDSQYASLEARLESFNRPNWNCKVAFRDLAEAGFYFLEHLTQSDNSDVPDRTRCFHCGGTLAHWVELDNPLEEHFKFFPRCAFLATIMPPDFVEFVLKKEDMIAKRLEFKESRAMLVQDVSRMRRFRYEDYQRMKRIAEITARDIDTRKEEKEDEEKDASSVPTASSSAISSAKSGFKSLSSLVTNYLSKFSFFSEASELSRYAENSTWHNNVSQARDDRNQRRTTAGKEAQQSFLINLPGLNDADSGTMSDPESNGQASPVIEERSFASDISKKVTSMEKCDQSEKDALAAIGLHLKDEKPKDRLLCTLCCERELNCVFLPCNHQLSCLVCSMSLKNCPVCRAKIVSKLRTFICTWMFVDSK